MRGDGDVRGVDVGLGGGRTAAAAPVPGGRKQGGSVAGAGRRPELRGRRKSGGKAEEPWRWQPEEARPRRGAVLVHGCPVGAAGSGTGRGTETPPVLGKGRSWASPGLRTPVGLQVVACPAAASRWDLQPRAAAWEILQLVLLRCRPGCSTQHVCTGDRTPATPLLLPWGSWLGSDQESGSPRDMGLGLGVLIALLTPKMAQQASDCAVPRVGPPQSPTPTQEVGDLPSCRCSPLVPSSQETSPHPLKSPFITSSISSPAH